MENGLNNMSEEDLCYAQASSVPTLKPGKAFIQIDSISIDLPRINSRNEKTPKCEHFSIRKYVSDMRQKESKEHCLFGSDKKSASTKLEPKFSLPPIDLPKFRWWQCQNCLEVACEKENGKSKLINNLNGECNSDGPSRTHIALTGSETTVLVSKFKQILKLDNSDDKGEANADILVQVTPDESHALLCSDQKEERDGRSDGTTQVSETGLEDDGYLELPRRTANTAEANESHGQEQGVDGAAGLPSISENHKEAGVVNLPKQLQREASHDCDNETEAMRSAGTLLVAIDGFNCRADNPTVQQNEHLSDELDYLSSDSAEVCPVYRSRDMPGALRNRKIRKVRLLSDLLGQNGNLNVNSTNRGESPLPSMSDASEEFGAIVVHRGRKVKRKLHPEDENQKAIVRTMEDDAFAMTSLQSFMMSGQISHREYDSSGLVTKKRKKKKNGVESVRNVVMEAIAVRKMGNAFSFPGLADTWNCNLTKHIDEGSLRIVTEKKNKNEPTQESFEDRLGESRGKLAIDFSPVSYDHDSLMGKEMGSSSFPLVKIDTNSCMCKKNSEMLQRDDGRMVQIPQSSSSMPSEDFVGGIKFGLVQSRSDTTQFLPYGDGAVNYARSLDRRPVSTIRQKEVSPEESQVRKKDTMRPHLEPNIPSRNRLGGIFKKAVRHNHKSRELSCGIPFANQNPRFASGFEDVGRFPMPQKEIPSVTSRGEITVYQEQSTATKNPTNKASAWETCSDDTTMEIAEHMAKIQYEKSLHDDVKDQTRKSPSYQNPRFCREYKNGDLNFLRKEGSMVDQVLPKYGKKLHNAKQKAADIKYSTHMNLNYPVRTQVEQNLNQYPFKGHSIVFSQYHEQPSGSKRNEDIVANSFKKSSGVVGRLSTCDTYHIAGPSKEPLPLWSSSTIPIAHVPSQENVPQNCILQSSDLKSPTLKDRNKSEEPKEDFVVENSSRENSYILRPNGVKLGLSDFRSNEEISALHLLSLTDDAHSCQNVNGTPIHANQSSSIPSRNPSKELRFGAYKPSDILGHLSSDYRTINFLASGKYNQQSAVATLGSSSSLFESGGNITNGVMGQLPLKVRGKGKKKCSDLIGSIGDFGSQKYVSSGCVSVPNQQRDEFIGLSTSAVFPPKCHTVDKCEEHLMNTTGSVCPQRYGSEMEICTINRNPAEFSIPEVGNVYTIRGNDLKFGKRVRAQEWSTASTIDLHRPKRGRKKKIVAENCQQAENEHHQSL